MAGFQQTFFIKMDLSHGHFYKTIEEAETAIKQYFKEHFFNVAYCIVPLNFVTKIDCSIVVVI